MTTNVWFCWARGSFCQYFRRNQIVDKTTPWNDADIFLTLIIWRTSAKIKSYATFGSEKKFWMWKRKIYEIWKFPTCNSLSVKNHIYLYSGNSEHGGGTSITSLSLQQILSSVGLFILKQSDFILLSVSTLPLQLGLGTQLEKNVLSRLHFTVNNLIWKNWSQIINLSLKKC